MSKLNRKLFPSLFCYLNCSNFHTDYKPRPLTTILTWVVCVYISPPSVISTFGTKTPVQMLTSVRVPVQGDYRYSDYEGTSQNAHNRRIYFRLYDETFLEQHIVPLHQAFYSILGLLGMQMSTFITRRSLVSIDYFLKYGKKKKRREKTRQNISERREKPDCAICWCKKPPCSRGVAFLEPLGLPGTVKHVQINIPRSGDLAVLTE